MTELRLPLSPRGWSFLALSSAALAAGLIRAEIAALLWGSLFFFLCIVSTALTLTWALALRRRLRSGHEPPHLRCTTTCLEDGQRLSLSAGGLAAVASRVPAVAVVARIEWDWRGLRSAWAEIELSGDDDERISVTLPGRGRYDMRLALIVRDTFGFARIVLPVTGTPSAGPDTPHAAAGGVQPSAGLRIHVLPRPAPSAVRLPRISGTGRMAPDRRERIRSDDMLEVRRYIPGDDPRRINWKTFARYGELFLRIGEEIPRPRGHVLCLLHAGAPADIETGSALALVDRAASVLLRLVEELVARGQSCDVLLPDAGASRGSAGWHTGRRRMRPEPARTEPVSARGDGDAGAERSDPIESLRVRLADVAPGDVLPPLPGDGAPHVFAIMPVGSAGGAGDPLPELERRSLPAAVFLVAPPASHDEPAQRRLPGNDRRLLQKRLERDMLEIQSSLPRDAYVELV